jgi:sugar phosphate isomerase/epimerase
MQLLFSTAAFFQEPLRDAFRAISNAGFEAVEVMVTKDPATQDAAALMALAEEHRLRIEAIHAPFLLLTRRVFGTDPVGKIHRSVHLAEEVGASLVVVHPPYRWQADYRGWLLDRLPAFSQRTGVSIAVENMFPLRLRGERGVRVHADQELDRYERFEHVTLDTSHAAVSGLDVVDAARRLNGQLAHVHLSNNAGRGWDSHLPVDEGVLPLGSLLEDLSAEGFRGNVSLELDIRAQLGDERATHDVLVRQREFCRTHMARRVVLPDALAAAAALS